MHYSLFFGLLLVLFICCTKTEKTYLNIEESVDYIGMDKCAACHSKEYNSFIQTGMGKSLRPAIKRYSSSIFETQLYDSVLNLDYHPYWSKDSLFVSEYHIEGDDTLNSLYRIEFFKWTR